MEKSERCNEEYTRLRRRWDAEDQLLLTRIGIFLTTNSILGAAAQLQEDRGFQVGVAFFALLISFYWLIVSRHSFKVIKRLHHITNRCMSEAEKAIYNFKTCGLRPNDVLVKLLPTTVILAWVFFIAWILRDQPLLATCSAVIIIAALGLIIYVSREKKQSVIVLLVHGAFQNERVWDYLKKELDEKGVQNISVNMPGRDPKKGDKTKLTLEDYVSKIETAIKDVDNKKRICLVCHSFAGIHGAIAASRHLSMIKSIVFLAANIAEQGETPYDLLAAYPSFQEELDIEAQNQAHIERSEDVLMKSFLNQCSNKNYSAVKMKDEFFKQYYTAEPAWPYFGVASYKADWKKYLKGRIYYYRGCEDKAIDCKHAVRYAGKAGTSLRQIEGNHQLMLSNPKGLCDEITKILQH